MLFAIFFGAGNLIFPSALGMESGPGLWEALLGFVLTGVGLPLLAIIVSAYYDDGYRTALDRIHPWFSLAFLAIVYLTVGPFFAIPRTGGHVLRAGGAAVSDGRGCRRCCAGRGGRCGGGW